MLYLDIITLTARVFIIKCFFDNKIYEIEHKNFFVNYRKFHSKFYRRGYIEQRKQKNVKENIMRTELINAEKK